MGAVEDHWSEATQDGQSTHIDDQIVVAKAGPALGEEDALVAALTDLLDGVAHVPGGDELTFFDVDGAAGLGGGDEQVGLAAEEGGDLQNGLDVAKGIASLLAILRGMNVGENGQTRVLGDGAEDAAAFDEAGPAKALDRGAVGLVVAGLEDVGDAEVRGDVLNSVRHLPRMSLGLDNAGTADKEELAAAYRNVADIEWMGHRPISSHPQTAV